MKIGYIRVSTQEQNTLRQEVLMEQLGVDAVYIDRMSGKHTDRPELHNLLEYVRRGDVVIVESISRFARNTRDLLDLVEQLTAKGVYKGRRPIERPEFSDESVSGWLYDAGTKRELLDKGRNTEAKRFIL